MSINYCKIFFKIKLLDIVYILGRHQNEINYQYIPNFKDEKYVFFESTCEFNENHTQRSYGKLNVQILYDF